MDNILSLRNFEQILKEVIDAIKKKYPDAIILLRDEIYEDEDINLDIFVEGENILSIDEEINRLVFNFTKETDFLILTNILGTGFPNPLLILYPPMESCPLKH